MPALSSPLIQGDISCKLSFLSRSVFPHQPCDKAAFAYEHRHPYFMYNMPQHTVPVPPDQLFCSCW